MGVRENKIERYLDEEITKIGGLTRKWTSNQAGVPDRIVIFNGHVTGVEVKTVEGKLSPVQIREHERLCNAGMDIVIVYGEREVDAFVRRLSDVDLPKPCGDRIVINGHVLYKSSDFKDTPDGDIMAHTVCEGGLNVCKHCGAAEMELDNPCENIK